MTISKRACALLSLFFVCSAVPTLSQTQISPALMSQIQQAAPGVSSSQVSSFLKNKSAQNLNEGSSKQSSSQPSATTTSGANEPEESVGLTKLKTPAIDSSNILNRSAYMNILQGKIVNPDSLLNKISVYGYDVFSSSKPSTFAPTDFSSVPSNYPVNIGDEIVVMLWGRINEEYRLKIQRDGTINIPRIGPVSVAGLPFDALQSNILDRVGKIEGVQASVSMGEMRSIGVYVVGEVKSPGFYTVSALTNITNVLFAAGGPTMRGSLRNIQLKRNGQLVSSVDFYDFLMSGTDRSGLRLQSGDVVVVPVVKSMAAVVGNVRRSALYELKGKTLLGDIINLAGGITPAGWGNKIQVERFEKNEYRSILDVDSASKKYPSFEIKDGDIIKIYPVLAQDKNAIYLTGNVLRPGKYEFHEGIKLLDVLANYEGLMPETYFNYAVILRTEPPTFLERIIAFNLKNALDNPSSKDNIQLQPQDKIVIYNKDFFEPDRSVIIDGAVTTPGKYKLLDNMKIRDIILQAGGLKEDASPTKGELYRRELANEQVITEKQDFCIDCAMQDDIAANMLLQRSDRIFIRSKKGWEEERKVTLKGQVMYPGTYVIFEGETLGDLIKRAGSFKEDAYLSAAIFSRKSVKSQEQKSLSEYSRQLQSDILKLSAEMAVKDQTEESQALLAQQNALKEKLASADTNGRVVINLTESTSYTNFALEDGDELYIPRNLNTISVIGEVYNPSTFKFETRQKTSYYIEAAGGLKETSDKKHIYIIKANGSIVTNKMTRVASSHLEPGDAVVVPQKIRYSNPHKTFVESVESIFKIATTLGTILAVVVAVKSLEKQ